MATMRAIDIKDGTGPVSHLFMNSDIPKPQPGKSQALIKIHAFGLNRMDLMQREGKYNVPPQGGKILGVEFSGVIEGLGSESDFKIGDEVFGLAYGGAYAEYLVSSTRMLIRKPKELSWTVAAGIPETWITATQALHLVGCFKPGDNVLWHAGASAVSIAGIQLAKAAGAKSIFVTAGSDDKIQFCEELGATKGFNYHKDDWVKGVLGATDGHGVDVTIDFIGKNNSQGNFEAAAMDGKIVQLASMSGSKLEAGLDIGLLENKRLRWEGSRLRSRDLDYQHKLRDLLVEFALPKFVDGTFQVPIEKVFDWKDIQEAHALMESNQSKGKIICIVS
ncbi:GroES-like protein [Mollisia scopiformis]|uniref:GroES-like protein n=1 Tax=Mollisia scopiformis TaxID=149040 RepID=A0A132BAR2_MOLSC|nr:GroES-like protein [Mollisia scopiformis]KUJ09502.1 GroES-like protein [Mollisia scopiformis]